MLITINSVYSPVRLSPTVFVMKARCVFCKLWKSLYIVLMQIGWACWTVDYIKLISSNCVDITNKQTNSSSILALPLSFHPARRHFCLVPRRKSPTLPDRPVQSRRRPTADRLTFCTEACRNSAMQAALSTIYKVGLTHRVAVLILSPKSWPDSRTLKTRSPFLISLPAVRTYHVSVPLVCSGVSPGMG